MSARETSGQYLVAGDVIVGNVYDKYGTKNPIARRLMNGFLEAVTDLATSVPHGTVLEVGCGEGRLAHHLAVRGVGSARFTSCDLSIERVAPDVSPRIQFMAASIYDLPFESRSFDLVVCCEVLEHLERPRAGLGELARVARGHLLISTPREPLWRALNFVRGKYLGDLGNTPGHLQHWSRRGLVALVEAEAEIRRVRAPLPWTVLLAEPRRSG